MNELVRDENYQFLVEQIKATITEAVHNSRWFLVEGYWNVGKLIREKFTGNNLTKQLQTLAVDVGISERTLWYCIQFYDRYPSLDTVPEGKNITWNKLITKYLPIKTTGKDSEDTPCPHRQVEILIRCARCRERLGFRKAGRDSVVDLGEIIGSEGEEK